MSPRINSKGGGEGGGPPPPPQINSCSIKSIPWGGGGHIDSINLFGGGGGGEGGGVKGPFLWYINSVPWPNQFSTHPYLCKQELQLCSSRARFREWPLIPGYTQRSLSKNYVMFLFNKTHERHTMSSNQINNTFSQNHNNSCTLRDVVSPKLKVSNILLLCDFLLRALGRRASNIFAQAV